MPATSEEAGCGGSFIRLQSGQRLDKKFKHNGTLTNIRHSVAIVVNNAGLVAGFALNFSAALDPAPFLWEASNGMTLLPLLPGDRGAMPLGLNNLGDVVGTDISSDFLHISGPDYSNDVSYAENALVLRDAIQEARQQMRSEGFAVTRADVFGHSMGGVLSRRWSHRFRWPRVRTWPCV